MFTHLENALASNLKEPFSQSKAFSFEKAFRFCVYLKKHGNLTVKEAGGHCDDKEIIESLRKRVTSLEESNEDHETKIASLSNELLTKSNNLISAVIAK